jgi:hypothetical protein
VLKTDGCTVSRTLRTTEGCERHRGPELSHVRESTTAAASVAQALQHHGSRRGGRSPMRSLHVCRTQLLSYPIQKHSRGFSSTACIHPEYSGIFQCNYIECSSCRVRPNASVERQRGCAAIETCQICEELNPSRRGQQTGRTEDLFLHEHACLTR